MREEDLQVQPNIKRGMPGEHCRPRQVEPMLSQPAFDWNVADRYVELLYFKMEVANTLQVKSFDLNDEEKVPVIKNWLGREGLQFIQTVINIEKEACKGATGMFNTLKILATA